MKQYQCARWIVVFTLLAGIFAASLLSTPFSTNAQSGRKVKPPESRGRVVTPEEQQKQQEKQEAEKPLAVTTPVDIDESGVIKLDTFLVTIPVSVTDRQGQFEPFLKKQDFRIYEDGVEQRIESFESVSMPFHVALVLDTSMSTQFKLEDIHNAAYTFVNQLRPDDQVMVMSFDSKVKVHSEFTNDRQQLRAAIYKTKTGGSTKLYDAVEQVLAKELSQVQGRKAVVLFTDGVDTSSRASASETLDLSEEADALVFSVRYDTEERQQNGPFGIPGGGGRTPPIGWPMPRRRGRWPFLQQWTQWPQGRFPQPRSGGTSSSKDYQRGERYLQELADRTGGRVYPGDTLSDVARAFAAIAEELRYQYRLSYYPTNSNQDGTMRQIKVRVMKPDLVVRARPGYKARSGAQAQSDSERPALKRKQLASEN
jgi:Mg-chelatase subunit ChlD